MATNQVEMYQISNSEEANNKENVILRVLVGDPARHKPLNTHPPPTTSAADETTPASMYTIESRYRPIPAKVLPKRTEPTVYYIESRNEEEPLGASAMMMKEEPEVPVLAEQEPPETVFIESKIISQPVLYSIVGAKDLPTQNNQPILIAATEVPSPLLYTITGEPHQPTTDTRTVTTSNVVQSTIERPFIFYTLVASPRLQVHIQEPVKSISEIPQQPSSNLYTVVGNPHVPPSIQEPIRNISQIPKQPSPILYSIVSNPTQTTDVTYTNTHHQPPSTEVIKDSSVQPVPILFTVVGETQVPNNISKENRPPLEPMKKQAKNGTMHGVVGNPTIPQSILVPDKAQPLQPPNQPQQVSAPSLYALVGKPHLPPKEQMETRVKPSAPKKTPLPAIVPMRRISRSLDRETAPEPARTPLTSISPIKRKHQPRQREPTIPKSETIFIPLPDNERTPRPKQSRVTLWHTSPQQTHHQSQQIPNYDPLQLPYYISPYAYHPLKSYREQTVHPSSLPIIKNNRAPRNPRPPLYAPHHRKNPHNQWSHHSLERYSVRPKEERRLWDYEHEAQSDGDDANDGYGREDHYRRSRLRTPWIPVW